MKYTNRICVDAGTANCPCPLAETGDCLICSRLSGEDKCDCCWCGLCIYNEFVQNDKKILNVRAGKKCRIAEKKWYGDDLLMLVLDVPIGLALKASVPGSFVFLNKCGEKEFYNVPISVMRSDIQNAQLHLALKVISVKTKKVAEAEDCLMVRGIYRSGLLGGGLETVLKQKATPEGASSERWLIAAKGIGMAPSVNIIDKLPREVSADMVIDTEKITEELISDSLSRCEAVREGRVNMDIMSLSRLLDRQDLEARQCVREIEDYEKVIILASDHYIHTLAAELNVPAKKLVYVNNFHMCCGEGICGACCHIDENGNVTKMCKCRRQKDL